MSAGKLLITVGAILWLLGSTGAAQAQATSAEEWLEQCEGGRGGWDRERYCELRHTGFRPADRRVAVDAGRNGGVSVRAWDRDSVAIIALVQVTGYSRGEARDFARDVEIEVRNGRISAAAPRSEGVSGWAVSYRIMVPRRSDLEIEARNGAIAVDGVSGDIRVASVNGAIRLTELAGNVHARTRNGALRVVLAGNGWLGAGLDAETSNGAVSVMVPRGYSADLEVGSRNGRVRIDVPMTVQGEIGRTMTGKLGSGGPPIRAVSGNGSASVRQD